MKPKPSKANKPGHSRLKFRIWKRSYCPACEFPTFEVYADINEAILIASEKSMHAIATDKLYMFFPFLRMKRHAVSVEVVRHLGWIDSKQLSEDRALRPYNAPQCGGFTLEAELGIPKNSRAEPDFLGWEVKQHAVTNFDRVGAGNITLMTPEPTSGFYGEQGLEAFVRRFGYADKRGREDRLNFGGIHRVGDRHSFTGLNLTLAGYDSISERIIDANGAVALVSDVGEVAAAWAFSGLLTHWTRKHAKAAYVPSLCRKEPARQYSYGDKVRLAQGTDFLRLLKAMANGAVYYDPGIKLEQASTAHPTHKGRSQFRIASKNIATLYQAVELVTL